MNSMRSFKKVITLLTILLAGFFLVSPGCKKYQYGPYLSLASKKQRIEGEWKVDSAVTRLGADIGSTFSTYRFSFKTNGDAAIEFIKPLAGEKDTLIGEWSLEEEKDLFAWKNMAGDTLEFYYTRDESFDILRLTAGEFWLADKDNTFLYLSKE